MAEAIKTEKKRSLSDRKIKREESKWQKKTERGVSVRERRGQEQERGVSVTESIKRERERERGV